MVSAVIVAGGKGTRMGADMNKVFLPVGEKEIISHTISAFNSHQAIDEIIIVTRACDYNKMKEIIRRDEYTKVVFITEGGSTRQGSVYNGLKLVSGDIVLIHDGARCLITHDEIDKVIADTVKFGAASVGVKVKDTLKAIDGNGNIISTVDREKTVHIQTPQAFKTEEILALHEMALEDKISVTDDCSIFEYYKKTVHLTEGSYDNIKLTTPEDIAVAEEILRGRI